MMVHRGNNVKYTVILRKVKRKKNVLLSHKQLLSVWVEEKNAIQRLTSPAPKALASSEIKLYSNKKR